MRQALGLSSEQDRRIAKILKGNDAKTRALMDRIRPMVRALKDSIRAEVRAELTPAQREIFDGFEHGLDAPPPDRPPGGRSRPHHGDGVPPREPPPDHGER